MSNDVDATEPMMTPSVATVGGALVAPDPPLYEDGGLDGLMGDPVTSYVYAIGQVEPRFPSLAVEKEFAQVTGRADTAGLTNRQALHEVLSDRPNRYLVRQLCWVLTVEGLDTYILVPRDPADVELLVESLRPNPRPTDVDVVVGVRAGMAPPETCNGLVVPIVVFEQIYSFDVDALVESIPRPDGADEEQFRAAAEELLWRILQMADNAGSLDEHRALNYLAVRYPGIYARVAEAFRDDSALTRVEVRLSRLSGVRKIVDVILTFVHRQTDVSEQYFVRVDVSEIFPFLVTKLMPYFDR
jgi:PatG C-terminal